MYDGELVRDFHLAIARQDEEGNLTLGRKANKLPSYLVFDSLVVNGENVMHLNFRDRLKKAEEFILRNHSVYAQFQEANPIQEDVLETRIHKNPYVNIFMKDVFEVWETPKLLSFTDEEKEDDFILMHENDGLIFTVDQCPYYPGTAPDIIKWKPVHLNTVDFSIRSIGQFEGYNVWSLSVITQYGLKVHDWFVFDQGDAGQVQFEQEVKSKLANRSSNEQQVVAEFNYRTDRNLSRVLIFLKLLRARS